MQYGKRIGRQLERAEVLLRGALENADIARDLERFGYTLQLLEGLQQMLRRVLELCSERERAFAAQLAASEALQRAHAAAELPFCGRAGTGARGPARKRRRPTGAGARSASRSYDRGSVAPDEAFLCQHRGVRA